MSEKAGSHGDKISWENNIEQSIEKPWETLAVGEMSLPQLARCLQECDEGIKKSEVLFRAMAEKDEFGATVGEKIKARHCGHILLRVGVSFKFRQKPHIFSGVYQNE